MERKAKTRCKELLKSMFKEKEDDLNWKTLKNLDVVCIKISSIPNAGFGIFANVNFEEHDVITEYKGKKLNNDEVLKLTLQNKFHYIAQVNSQNSIDGLRKIPKNKNCFGSIINDAQNYKQTNCILYCHRNKLFIVAIKPILKNQELFLNYGKKYWETFCQNAIIIK